jgi:hypothetical protein
MNHIYYLNNSSFFRQYKTFFCRSCFVPLKNFVSFGATGLSLTGKGSVITFIISSTSAAEGVAGVSSSRTNVFGSGDAVFLFLAATTFGSGLNFSFFFFVTLVLSLSLWCSLRQQHWQFFFSSGRQHLRQSPIIRVFKAYSIKYSV